MGDNERWKKSSNILPFFYIWAICNANDFGFHQPNKLGSFKWCAHFCGLFVGKTFIHPLISQSECRMQEKGPTVWQEVLHFAVVAFVVISGVELINQGACRGVGGNHGQVRGRNHDPFGDVVIDVHHSHLHPDQVPFRTWTEIRDPVSSHHHLKRGRAAVLLRSLFKTNRRLASTHGEGVGVTHITLSHLAISSQTCKHIFLAR